MAADFPQPPTDPRLDVFPEPNPAWSKMTSDVPDRIDAYEIDRVIARGAHGVVFKATDAHGLKVAIKWLTKRRDEGELDTVVQLSKKVKGLPPILSSGVLEDRTYYVMPYYERRSLRFRLRALPFPQPMPEVIRLAKAFTDVLGELHRHGYTHFDFKPDNLLIEALPSASESLTLSLLPPDERLVLTDFGTTRTTDGDDHFGDGTPGYAAPELLTKIIDHDPRVDVYAASATLVECMTGVAPEQVRKSTDTAFDDDVLKRTGPFEPVLRRGLSFDPDRRPETISTWFDGLRTQVDIVDSFADHRPRPDSEKTSIRQSSARTRQPSHDRTPRSEFDRPSARRPTVDRQASKKTDGSTSMKVLRNVGATTAAVAVVLVGYAGLTQAADRPLLSSAPNATSSGNENDSAQVGTESATPSSTRAIRPYDETAATATNVERDPTHVWVSRITMREDLIEVIWESADDATAYHLHRIPWISETKPAVESMTPENEVHATNDNGTFADAEVEPGGRYWYGVRAVDPDGALIAHGWHSVAAVTDDESPSMVGGLSAVIDSGEVRVKWDRPEDNYELSGYRVLRAVDGGEPETVAATWDIKQTAFVDDRPPAEGRVTYSVVAMDFHWNLSEPAEVEVELP